MTPASSVYKSVGASVRVSDVRGGEVQSSGWVGGRNCDFLLFSFPRTGPKSGKRPAVAKNYTNSKQPTAYIRKRQRCRLETGVVLKTVFVATDESAVTSRGNDDDDDDGGLAKVLYRLSGPT